jgi:hypothetical protein
MNITQETAKAFDHLLVEVCLETVPDFVQRIQILEIQLGRMVLLYGKESDEAVIVSEQLEAAKDVLTLECQKASRYITTTSYRCGDEECRRFHRALLVGLA